MLTHPWNTDFAWQRPSASPRRLSEAEVEQCNRDGWVVPGIHTAVVSAHEYVDPVGAAG